MPLNRLFLFNVFKIFRRYKEMALFKKGYEAVRVEKKRQEDARENMGNRLFRFFLSKDGAEARVRFLTEEPINFNEHTVKVYSGGKERYNNVICSGEDDCTLCADDDKPSFKGAFLIWDYSEYESKDKNGKKKTVKGSLKLYVAGTRVLSQLDRLSSRYGLTSRDYEISRAGSGTDTTYMFERTDEDGKLTKAQITNMLTENMKKEFDGTIDSLYDIVKEQLTLYLPKGEETEDEEDDTPQKTTKSTKKSKLVDYEDDDEDEGEDEEYDDSAVPFESAPLKKTKKPLLTTGKKSSIKGVFKK